MEWKYTKILKNPSLNENTPLSSWVKLSFLSRERETAKTESSQKRVRVIKKEQ
jgi:hypothetical protein